jgi:hypothetical protein
VTDNVAHTGTMSASERVSARGWNLVVFASALLTGVGVALAPTVSTYSCYTSEAETARCWSSSVSLFSNEGVGVLGVLAVPALVALVPLVLRSRRAAMVTAAMLTVAALVASASVGIFFIPTVVLAWVAVVATPRR